MWARVVPWIVLLFWLAWTGIILCGGLGVLPVNLDERTLIRAGAFGDSFGAVASLMATLAASGAFFAYQAQQKDSKLQQFERNFYSLLSNFQGIVQAIDVVHIKRPSKSKVPDELQFFAGEHSGRTEGREALRVFAVLLRLGLSEDDFRDTKIIERIYKRLYVRYQDDLGHYFRLLYQIFRLIEESCPVGKSYYARIVRAHLSNSELILLAYNVTVGEGRFKFAALVEKYAVLHNSNREELVGTQKAELRFFERRLPSGCFQTDENPALRY